MAVLCLLITLGSCSKDDVPAEIIPNPDSENYFTKSLDFTSDSGEAILSFTTNKDWAIDVSQSGGDVSWCTIFPNKGKAGENQVMVKVAENKGFDDRNVTLTLTAKDLTRKIVVTQKQKDAITLTTAKFEIDQIGGEIKVDIKANVSYEIIIPEQYQSWIRHKAKTDSNPIIMSNRKEENQIYGPVTKAGMESTTQIFRISKSEKYDKREGEIIFQSGNLKEVLKVYQSGGGILLLTKNEYRVSDKGEQIAVELKSNFDFDVKMPQVDWITTTVTRSVSSHTLYYTIAPNKTYDKREAEIIYYDRNNKSVVDTLKIIQTQKEELHIKLETAGSLNDRMKSLNINHLKIKRLVLEGDINGSDIRLIREMAGVDYIEKKTDGILEYLDLTNANIVKGGEVYCYPEVSHYKIGHTENNVIGDCMFSKCNSLKEILLPYSCIKIENASFAHCKNLMNVKIFNNVTTIGEWCFNSCSLLPKIDLPNSISNIGKGAFHICTSLEYINLPSKITYLPRALFFNCPSLKEIVIPEPVKSIDTSVFSYCSSLKSIVIPDNVRYTEDLFDECTSLEKITLGKNFISGSILCKNLKEIHSRAVTPPSTTFTYDVYNYATLYVPKGCYEAYHTAVNWRYFKTIIEE